MEEVIRLFPKTYHSTLSQYVNWKTVQEIRLRVLKPIEVVSADRVTAIPSSKITMIDLSYVLNQVSHFSLYKFKEEVKEGFITIQGGHRVGLAGKANLDNGKVATLKDITFMNIRIARSSLQAGKNLVPYLCEDGQWLNTLIVGPPHSGKTTILRNLAKLAGARADQPGSKKVAIVDERSEIAACQDGVPQLDVGERTDVMDGCPKASGLMMMIRSMSPEVIIVDEMGGLADAAAVQEAVYSGVQVICSVHGSSFESVAKRPSIHHMMKEKIFDRYVILERLNIDGENRVQILNESGRELALLKGERGYGMDRGRNRFSRYHVDRV
ncbi:stage III sporulation protein AA [Halobacillus sp. Marseille-Q1614]|uniref:stage III sporulation protein AA n=1 Tax=Halobacillus sp. Marseille-Q1614 TaxID=2709134 RepID=UPI0015714698|nr:stage III sporulation protein AA [Halobacillus sp. Marseille-Q1614]